MKNNRSQRSIKTKKSKPKRMQKRIKVLIKKIDRNTKTLKKVKVLMKKAARSKKIKKKIEVQNKGKSKSLIVESTIFIVPPSTDGFLEQCAEFSEKKKTKKIKNSKGRFVPVDPETRVYDDIARNSRGPFCKTAPRAFKEDHNKGAVDSSFLVRADFEQIEHEHRLEVPHVGLFKSSNTGEITHELNSGCDCKCGETCEICMTKEDLAATPKCKMEVVEIKPNIVGQRQFKVRLPVEVAENLERVV